MKHATSIALHDYWQDCHGRAGVRAGGLVAAELAPILPSLFLTDLDLSAGLRFRFCGAEIATRYGRDLADESFLDLWGSLDRATLERDVRTISVRSAGLVAGVMAETVGAGFTSFEMLFLPVAGGAGAAGMIGSMVRIGGHEEKNRIRARVVSQSLRSVRFLAPPAPHLARPVASVATAAVSGPSEARRRYRHLTVVPGGMQPQAAAGGAALTDI
jgi:hypothetical protein